MYRTFILGLIAGYFLLWAYFSNWDPHLMIFWEGNEPSDPKGPYFRIAVGFVLFVTAIVTLMSRESK